MFRRKKNIAVIGANGMLGYDVVEYLTKLQYRKRSCIGIVRPLESCYDIRNYESMYQFFVEYKIGFIKYDIIVNCAAMTDVTKIEKDKEYRDNAYSVNVIGPRVLAEICKNFGIKLIHISTDYVYSQKSALTWTYPNPSGIYTDLNAFHRNNSYEFPVNIYGMQKLEGEQMVASILPKKQYAILRTSWLYGMHGNKSFVHTFLKNFLLWKKEHDAGVSANDKFTLPSDGMSVPTRTTELAGIIYHVIKNNITGIIPACGYQYDVGDSEDYAPSWFRFGQEILQIYDSELLPLLAPAESADPSRPKFSRMFNGGAKDRKALFGSEYPPAWTDQLMQFIDLNRTEIDAWLKSQGCFADDKKEKIA